MTPPRRQILVAVTLLGLSLAPRVARTQVASPGQAPDVETASEGAMIRVDGHALFRVVGSQSLPAPERARLIADRIARAADDRSLSPDSLRMVETEIGTQITLGERLLLVVTDSDARIERLSRSQLVPICGLRLRQAIVAYRLARSPENLLKGALLAAIATLALAASLFFIGWLRRRTRETVESRIKASVSHLKIQSLELVRAESLWGFVDGAMGVIRLIVTLILIFLYLDYGMSLFPWTREAASRLLDYLLIPVRSMGAAFVGYLPSLLFLTVLALVSRLVFGTLRLLTGSIERGQLVLRGFDREWAWPTYQIVRVVLLALVAVVAFPYIPGSSSPAFQGLSIFFGVLLSLGSSSLVSNLIAGYCLIYWRALRVGDWVQIGDVLGDVVETRVMVTRLRTPKNEEIVIPNSAILAGKIFNYSALARTSGLILHTSVGIGYEVPWRQVEAMLLMAAERTAGLLREPKPFVLQRALGDFAVTYELNVYSGAPHSMLLTYSALHRNILDAFNEYGVQIMTPAYEGDPAEAKVVPKQRWHDAPAAPPAAGSPPP